MYLFPCFWIESVFDSIPNPIPYVILMFILMKYYVLLYLIGFSNYFHVLREREKIVSRETFYVLSHAYLEIYTYALISMC